MSELLFQVDWRTLPSAPAPGTALCTLQEIEPGSIREFAFTSSGSGEPEFRLLVFRDGDKFHAYVNQCPHQWLRMNREDGKFLKWSSSAIMCIHHSAVFDLANGGLCSMGPCQGSNLVQVPLVVTEDRLLIGN